MSGIFPDKCPAAPEITMLQSTEHDRVTVCEIEIVLPEGEPVSAFYIKPKAEGKYPAILYSHWLEKAPDDNKTQFLEEAKQLAARGYVCLLVDTIFADWPESRLKWTGSDIVFDRGIILRQIKELRHALAFLRAGPEVDRERLALVGHDFGAMFNALLTGIEDGIKACVIMAAAPDFSDWFTLGREMTEAESRTYHGAMADLAPVRYLAAAHRTDFLFQFGENDLFFVPKEKAKLLVDGTAGPRTVKWYDIDHAIHHHPGATKERVNWLLERLSPDIRSFTANG